MQDALIYNQQKWVMRDEAAKHKHTHTHNMRLRAAQQKTAVDFHDGMERQN